LLFFVIHFVVTFLAVLAALLMLALLTFALLSFAKLSFACLGRGSIRLSALTGSIRALSHCHTTWHHPFVVFSAVLLFAFNQSRNNHGRSGYKLTSSITH
jgi:hypothetical protein|tara:strand:+ start:224 stop:523 length:300 start_codon:yes stop_codon:yes gene_type:complete